MLNERLFAAASGASGWARLPTIAADAMVATSHPLATRAGVRALEAGGNAVDAALAAAAMLTVCEPPHNGVGGDAFAVLWLDGELHGLNGSGRAPAHIDALTVDPAGPRSVTVPGAVRAWSDAAERFGRLGLDAALAGAIDAARNGVAATARIAEHWRAAQARAPWPAPRPGRRYRLPDLAATLQAIADRGPDAIYQGPIAAAIAAACWLSEDDLAAHRSEWVTPLRRAYRGVEVCELPPNTQGAAALVALGIAEELDGDLHGDVEAAKLALDWAARTIGDAPVELPDAGALRARIGPRAAADTRVWSGGGTTYLCTVDGERNAVSWIQSLFEGFGAGVAVGDTGIALQNRGAGFTEEEGHPNRIAPGKRPFHTIIPGLLLRDGRLPGPFGVMGGSMQAQAHFQLVRHVVDGGLDPQAALDAARFRVLGGERVALEPGLAALADDLRARGHDVHVAEVAARLRRGPDDPRRGRRARRRVGRPRRWPRRRAVSRRVLTERDLNRALLARQMLLERAPLSIPRALERMGGLQAQYAPSMYVGLSSRIEGFERDALTRALERRSVVQGTLMRSTIHLVSARDYWPLALTVERPRRDWWLKANRDGLGARDMSTAARRLRPRLAGGTMRRGEVEQVIGKPQAAAISHWLHIVRAPPSGTWERRRADLYGLAEDWLGPPDIDHADAVDHTVRRYLGGFGPASPAEIANWAGVPPAVVAPALERLRLRRFASEDGEELVDLPRAPLPDPETPAPVRLLGTWDAILLAHARRANVLPERFRDRVFHVRMPQSVTTFLVDGSVAGTWRHEDGRVAFEPFERLDRATLRALSEEGERMAALYR